MPEAAQDIHDSKDLGNQVGVLLDQMQAGTQRLKDEAGASGADEALADAVAALANDTAGAGAANGAAPPVEPDAPDLASAVEKLIEESQGAPPPAPAAPTAAATPPVAPTSQGQKIDSLDAELAGHADSVIAGEFADESVAQDEVQPSVAAPVAREPAKPAPRPEPAEPADVAPTPPLLSPAVDVEARRPEAAPAPTPAPPVRAPEPAGPSLLLRAMAAVSAPVESKPHLRDTLGWVALVQGFFAACLWIWVMFFRPDRPLDPPPVTPAKEKGEHAPSEHGEKKSGGHGEKKAPKKDDKPKKKPAAASAGH